MADPELIELLEQGSDVWNSWLELNPAIRLDLSGALLSGINLSGTDLSGADLSGADLSKANLSKANLSGALLIEADLSRALLIEINLSGAILSETDLSKVNLSKIDLIGAELSRTNLSEADLRESDLSRANLSRANLSRADLSGADLSGANLNNAKLIKANLDNTILRGTILSNVDLRMTKGLINIEHRGPSRIELHTVQLPQDGSALHFLRGCGIDDEWIDFYQAQMMSPIQYYSCFISYAHQDNDLAHRLHADLQDKGVRCWFAPHDMHIGDKIRSRIDEAIHLQDKLLLIFSEEAVNSDWVEHEVETALAKERREKRTILFPIRLDNAILERPYTGWAATVQNERHIGDFTGWKDHDRYQAAFDRLIRDLKKADENHP